MQSELKSSIYRLTDPRQVRIYDRLALIGPGAAAFYRDACRIMDAEPFLESATHLVSHLLREIESSLRDVLEPIAEHMKGQMTHTQGKQTKETSGNKKHQAEIEAILKSLEIPESDSRAQIWLSLAGSTNNYGLHSRAHRDTLARPRPIDQEFRKFWDQMETLFDFVLDKFEAQYLETHRLIDELLMIQSPSTNEVKRLRNHVPNNRISLGYFFDNLISPLWLSILRSEGFFDHPPDPVVDDDQGTIWFPPWPASSYLARVVVQEPRQVCDIVQSLPPITNSRVLADLLNVAIALPVEMIVELVPQMGAWFAVPYQHFNPRRVLALLEKLLAGDQVDIALQVTRFLLVVVPDPRLTLTTTTHRIFSGLSNLQPRIDHWCFLQILQLFVPRLANAAGEDTVEILADSLEAGLRLLHANDTEAADDNSHIWRPAIDDHEQNGLRSTQDATDHLITALRDTATQLMPNYGDQVLMRMEARSFSIFKRIGLHLRRLYPDSDRFGTMQLIAEGYVIHETSLRHELFLLLQDTFHLWPFDVQQAYLRHIADGPKPKGSRQDPDVFMQTEEEAAYQRYWEYRWLLPVQKHLDSESQERFSLLQEEFAPQQHPDFDIYSSRLGDLTPGNKVADLSAMSTDELIAHLQNWSKTTVQENQWPAGLVGTLQELVQQHPERFISTADRFCGLPLVFANAVIETLHVASAELQVGASWSSVLQLCQWITSEVAQKPIEPISETRDGTRSRYLQVVARLLIAGLQHGVREIPFDYRLRVWDVLEVLTDDPDPTSSYETESKLDVLTLAVNTVRSTAMRAVIAYALWVRRHRSKTGDNNEKPLPGFDDMPEVRRVLNRHLDTGRESSLAVRSVYGQWLPKITFLDTHWVRQNIERIFPCDEQLYPMWSAAWGSYVSLNAVHMTTALLLHTQYHYAIAQLGRSALQHISTQVDPNRRLAEHLMILYWSGAIGLEEPQGLLRCFYTYAPLELRAHAMAFLGQQLAREKDPLEAATYTRLCILWNWRLEQTLAAPDQHDAEAAAFGWWFCSSQVDTTWAIEQLHQVLASVKQIDPARQVVERLANIVDGSPIMVIQCLGLILNATTESWHIDAWGTSIQKILHTALQSHDDASRREARTLIHRLGARGFLGFRSLLKADAHEKVSNTDEYL